MAYTVVSYVLWPVIDTCGRCVTQGAASLRNFNFVALTKSLPGVPPGSATGCLSHLQHGRIDSHITVTYNFAVLIHAIV